MHLLSKIFISEFTARWKQRVMFFVTFWSGGLSYLQNGMLGGVYMEWITVYEISSFALPLGFFIGIVFIVGGVNFFLDIFSQENRKKKATFGDFIQFLLCPVFVIIGCLVVWFEGEAILTGEFNKEAKAYYDGEYTVIAGVAENIDWSNGGFFFSVEDLNFHCEQDYNKKRREQTEPRFESGKTLRVYYYDKEYFDEYAQEYQVMRIDVWDVAE